jgi:hypothetical protein
MIPAPQFKIHGKERRALKKKLSLMRRSLHYFYHNWQVNDDMYLFCGHCNPVSKNKADKIYNKCANEIDELEKLLAEPYGGWVMSDKKSIHKEFDEWLEEFDPQNHLMAMHRMDAFEQIWMYFNQSRWISVEDRLPEDCSSYAISRMYLICNDGFVTIGYWFPVDKIWSDGKCDITKQVSHWQPLPEPPGGE